LFHLLLSSRLLVCGFRLFLRGLVLLDRLNDIFFRLDGLEELLRLNNFEGLDFGLLLGNTGSFTFL